MALSTAHKHKLLDATFRNTAYSGVVHIQLHDGDPGSSGTENVISGPTRRQVSAAAPASGAIENDADLEWENMPETTVSHLTLWDASAGGNLVGQGPLDSPISVPADFTFIIVAGDFTFDLNA